MADISADLFTWSSTASSNQPTDATVIGAGLDDNLRAIQAGVRGALEPLSGVAGINTITASATNLSAYATGLYFFVPAATNTAATTLNINGLGAKNIYWNGAALVGSEIRISVPVLLYFDGTQFTLIGSGAHANAYGISDALFAIQDDGDRTKQVQFQASGITTATTRTVTVPDKSGTLAMTSDLAVTATESVSGIIEIATQAETDAGTDDARAVTPLKLQTKAALTTIASGSFAATTVAAVTSIPATYSKLILYVSGASSDTASRQPLVRVSTNNGSSYDSTAGNYPGRLWESLTPSWTAKTLASLVEATVQTGAQTSTFVLEMSGYQGGPNMSFNAEITAQGGNNFNTAGRYSGSTSAINAIQILWSGSGNFDAGTYALYGVK